MPVALNRRQAFFNKHLFATSLIFTGQLCRVLKADTGTDMFSGFGGTRFSIIGTEVINLKFSFTCPSDATKEDVATAIQQELDDREDYWLFDADCVEGIDVELKITLNDTEAECELSVYAVGYVEAILDEDGSVLDYDYDDLEEDADYIKSVVEENINALKTHLETEGLRRLERDGPLVIDFDF